MSLLKAWANLAEVNKANKAPQQELYKDKSLTCVAASDLKDEEENAKKKN